MQQITDWITRHKPVVVKGREAAPVAADTPAPISEAALLMDAMEDAWGLIANASGGAWSKESEGWQEAARRWRDEQWHPALKRNGYARQMDERLTPPVVAADKPASFGDTPGWSGSKAQPAGDDAAAVQALVDGMRANTGTMHGMAIGALAAIRRGDVPGISPTVLIHGVPLTLDIMCAVQRERDDLLAKLAEAVALLHGRVCAEGLQVNICPHCFGVVTDDDTIQERDGVIWHARCKDQHDESRRTMFLPNPATECPPGLLGLRPVRDQPPTSPP